MSLPAGMDAGGQTVPKRAEWCNTALLKYMSRHTDTNAPPTQDRWQKLWNLRYTARRPLSMRALARESEVT